MVEIISSISGRKVAIFLPSVMLLPGILTFLVVRDEGLGDGLTDSVDLGNMTTTVNSDTDINSGEFILKLAKNMAILVIDNVNHSKSKETLRYFRYRK